MSEFKKQFPSLEEKQWTTQPNSYGEVFHRKKVENYEYFNGKNCPEFSKKDVEKHCLDKQKVKDRLKDHYWDSFEQDKELILKHIFDCLGLKDE